MIKKISRPKQVNNQDKQAPKTIQELMQRYDLDNKEVCDYLDYLIEHLIQEKQELNKKIETNADNINNKVSKTGDTITGNLILNKAHYLKGIDEDGNYIGLIRAHNGYTAVGDSNKETRIWSSVMPTIQTGGKTYTIATREPLGYMVVGLSANTAVTTAAAWTGYTIPLNSLKKSIGSGLTFTNNTVKIGAGISRVKVSALAMHSNDAVTSSISGIMHNTAIIEIGYVSGKTGWQSVSYPQYLIDVKENDTISLFYQSNTANGTFRFAGNQHTLLIVEVIS